MQELGKFSSITFSVVFQPFLSPEKQEEAQKKLEAARRKALEVRLGCFGGFCETLHNPRLGPCHSCLTGLQPCCGSGEQCAGWTRPLQALHPPLYPLAASVAAWGPGQPEIAAGRPASVL